MTAAPELVLTDEFRAALDHLGGGANLFLTGRAGTGKSTLIRQYMQSAGRKTVVVAPTGIAALNVGGYTIHRLFGFTPRTTPEDVQAATWKPARFRKVISELETLVVDEASMLRADVFDTMAIVLERFGPKPGTPFGGVQVVLVGDLYQLPPVVVPSEEEYFTSTYESPFFFSAHRYDRAGFPVVELTTVFRQLGDDNLIRLLNAVRDGSLTEDARDALNLRVRSGFTPPLGERWLTLTTTNRIAGARNKAMLDRIVAPDLTSEAVSRGDLEGYEPMAEQTLRYKVGAQIMLLTNDSADRWVNGTIGEIAAVADDDGSPRVTVLLPDRTVADIGPFTWEVTRPSVVGGRLEHEVIGTFTQLPFKLAWAITIHKSQGQTLERCVVDLAGGTFADGQLYVGLSRCTSLDGLVLTQQVQPKDLKVNQRIRRYLSSRGTHTGSTGTAYLGICTVGEPGRMSRPRPVEIAVVTEAGDEISTLVNPERDMGAARTAYGITATDALLAPRLREAWAALAPFLAGRTAVGHDVDGILSEIDYELKRTGLLSPVPLGNTLTPALSADERLRLASRSALERARAARDVDQRERARTSSDVFPDATGAPGYLLPRRTSPVIFSVTGEAVGELGQTLVGLLGDRAAHAAADPEAAAVLRGVEAEVGVVLLPAQSAVRTITDVLVDGAGVCFTGSATTATEAQLAREDLEARACDRGLSPEQTVTKKRCHAVVAAEAGSQSGKAKKARDYGIPVYSVDEFVGWCDGLTPAALTPGLDPSAAPVLIVPVPVPRSAALPVARAYVAPESTVPMAPPDEPPVHAAPPSQDPDSRAKSIFRRLRRSLHG